MEGTITVKQLADKAGIEPRILRRILRSQFPREAKGKLYEWQPDDPQIELILKAVKDRTEKPKAEAVKSDETKAKTQAKKQPEQTPEKEAV